jgi:adenosylhomocysteine nucleosidase
VATELTAVLFALKREARFWVWPASRVAQAPCETYSVGGEFLVLYTGMGQAAAGRAVDWLLNTRPNMRRVISAGFCGGLVEQVRVGDVVTPGRVVADGGEFVLPGNSPITLVTVAQPVITPADRARLHEATGGQVVDMETAVIARRCAAAGVVCESVRAVSDDCRHGLPSDLLPALDGDRVRLGRLLLAVCRRPGLVLDLRRLNHDSRLAASGLAAALDEKLRGR